MEVAKSFAGKGYDLHITSRSLESAEKIAYALKQEYPEVQVYPYALDLKDVKDICRVFSKVKENSGKLDVFVANAAGATLVTPDCLKNDDYEGIMKKAMEFTRICKA